MTISVLHEITISRFLLHSSDSNSVKRWHAQLTRPAEVTSGRGKTGGQGISLSFFEHAVFR